MGARVAPKQIVKHRKSHLHKRTQTARPHARANITRTSRKGAQTRIPARTQNNTRWATNPICWSDAKMFNVDGEGAVKCQAKILMTLLFSAFLFRTLHPTEIVRHLVVRVRAQQRRQTWKRHHCSSGNAAAASFAARLAKVFSHWRRLGRTQASVSDGWYLLSLLPSLIAEHGSDHVYVQRSRQLRNQNTFVELRNTCFASSHQRNL